MEREREAHATGLGLCICSSIAVMKFELDLEPDKVVLCGSDRRQWCSKMLQNVLILTLHLRSGSGDELTFKMK